MDKLDELIKQLVAFRNERDWEKVHTPRNLTTALASDKQPVAPPIGSTPDTLKARLLSVIKQSQDFWEALFSLSIRTSTLKKFLDGHPLSEPTRKKLAKALSQTHPFVGLLPTSEEQQSLSDAISTLIADERCIFELSSRAGVSRSTIRKVLAKQKITHVAELKLRQALADLEASSPYSFSKESVLKKLIDIHNLYLEHKTLEAVGKRIGLTRERVRQLLQMGTSLGLFEYKPRGKEDLRKCITRDELLAAYKIHSNLNEVAAAYQISLHDLHSLLASYSITTKQLETLRRERQRQKCIEGYDCAIKELGHHPSTVEMCKRPEWRALLARITRLWGTIGAFRQDLGIPKPKPKMCSNPVAQQRFKQAVQQRSQQAASARDNDMDSIKRCLNNFRSLSKREVAIQCNLSEARTQKLLSLLVQKGDVKRVGLLKSNKVKYALV